MDPLGTAAFVGVETSAAHEFSAVLGLGPHGGASAFDDGYITNIEHCIRDEEPTFANYVWLSGHIFLYIMITCMRSRGLDSGSWSGSDLTKPLALRFCWRICPMWSGGFPH